MIYKLLGNNPKNALNGTSIVNTLALQKEVLQREKSLCISVFVILVEVFALE